MSFSSLFFIIQLAGTQAPLDGDPRLSDDQAVAMTDPSSPDQADLLTEVPQPTPPTSPVPDQAITVTARPAPPPGDPMRAINAESFKLVQTVDKGVTGPVARGYKKTVPSPIRSGLRNALRNLSEPIVFVNDLLQLRPGRGLRTLGRFTINSTMGVAGLFDVAKSKPFNLPYCINGFAYTLGYYGVKPGPYMYLPLIGPTTVRDLAGRLGDISFLPLTVGKPFNELAFTVPTTTVRLVDERAEADGEIRMLLDSNSDPYAAIRDTYLQKRQVEIDELRHARTCRQSTGSNKAAPSPVS